MTAGHEFYKKLTCPKAEHVVRSVDGGEAHCKIEFDWLDGVFNRSDPSCLLIKD
jgi:hypothetical protein